MIHFRRSTAVLFVVRVAFGGVWGHGSSGLMFGSLHGVVVVVVVEMDSKMREVRIDLENDDSCCSC